MVRGALPARLISKKLKDRINIKNKRIILDCRADFDTALDCARLDYLCEFYAKKVVSVCVRRRRR